MAKTHGTDPAAERDGRIMRTEAYAKKIQQMFAATVNSILELNYRLPDIDDGEMYSFDADSEKVQMEVEALLRRLHSAATLAIRNGIEVEWKEANNVCDRLVQSCFGKRFLSDPKFKSWTDRNEAARDAFMERADRGMNLSRRVWRDVQQLRDEMEVALTVSMGEGQDAGTISRRVRQYLNDPDLMFRRFRYQEKEPVTDKDGNVVMGKDGKPLMQPRLGKDGQPIWRTKWKKRINDPDKPGKHKWIDYDRDSYVPAGAGKNSRGVYKSAAKNSMRLARTETNIAYRRADHERWQRMEFVLGVRVQVSRSHASKMPMGDICDELAGDYPKDFVFDGWHPQCFCYATPILPSDEELEEMANALDEGREYRPRGVVRDYPQGFRQWVQENEEKIFDKTTSNPYFVTNNAKVVARILKGDI